MQLPLHKLTLLTSGSCIWHSWLDNTLIGTSSVFFTYNTEWSKICWGWAVPSSCLLQEATHLLTKSFKFNLFDDSIWVHHLSIKGNLMTQNMLYYGTKTTVMVSLRLLCNLLWSESFILSKNWWHGHSRSVGMMLPPRYYSGFSFLLRNGYFVGMFSEQLYWTVCTVVSATDE